MALFGHVLIYPGGRTYLFGEAADLFCECDGLFGEDNGETTTLFQKYILTAPTGNYVEILT